MRVVDHAIQGMKGLARFARRAKPWMQGQRGLLAGAWIAMLFEVGLRLLEPWPLKILFDELFKKPGTPHSFSWSQGMDPTRLLVVCVGAMVAIASLRAVAAWIATVGLSLVGNRVLSRCRKELFDHLMRLSLSFHQRSGKGDLLNRVVSDVGRVQEVAVTALLPFLTHILTLSGMMIVMLWMDVRLGLIALGVVPVFIFISSSVGTKLRSAARDQRRREGEMATSASEALGAIRVSHAYGLGGTLGAIFDHQNNKSLRDGVRGARLSAGLERSVDIMIAVAGACVIWLGASRALKGEVSPGDLIVFVSYLRSAFRPLKDAAKFAGRMAKASASGERILEVLETHPEIQDRSHAQQLNAPITSLEFSHVTFGHDPTQNTLADVSFRVQRGERLVLVGSSGAGKSSVLNLVLRLHDANAGRVLVNGEPIDHWTVASLRSGIAVVLQESVLFRASIHENIACATQGATRAGVERAAMSAGIHDFVKQLPEGYDTVLGERGDTLSGGQRQRIAIARAVIRNANLLLLDEPTSGLDHATSEHVNATLDELEHDRITVLATHDLACIREQDIVALLEHGRVIEHGRHSVLRDSGGRYAEMYAAQQCARPRQSIRESDPHHTSNERGLSERTFEYPDEEGAGHAVLR